MLIEKLENAIKPICDAILILGEKARALNTKIERTEYMHWYIKTNNYKKMHKQPLTRRKALEKTRRRYG